MTNTAAEPLTGPDASDAQSPDAAPDSTWRRVFASRRIVLSGSVLLAILRRFLP